MSGETDEKIVIQYPWKAELSWRCRYSVRFSPSFVLFQGRKRTGCMAVCRPSS